MLQKCAPKLVFTAQDYPLDLSSYQTIVVDRENQFDQFASAKDGECRPAEDVAGTNPAYIMFTSGSTGFPKGAVMSHANVLNFVEWARWEFSITADDVFTNVNPLYFDNSVFDIYASIMNGASLVPFDAAMMKDPYETLQRITSLRCTTYFSVPSLLIYFQTLKLVTPAAMRSVRQVIFGGEGYPKTKLREVFECFRDRAELVNVYGPTECTCICSSYRLTGTDFEDLAGYPPLGGPIPNFTFVMLDDHDEPTAQGEVGELYLGGPGLGLGYFNDPELTAGAFRQNPLNKLYDERLYRTGDLVRRSKHDGKVYFVGRKDSQIKHQGYRIELGEIEHALCRIPGVDEAVAIHGARNGLSQIVAVVGSRTAMAATQIREKVAAIIPAYMVPSKIDVFDRLPRNDNGKIDRKFLKDRYTAET